MKPSTWSLKGVLAWTWVACLVLLWLTAYTPLHFNSYTKHLLALHAAWGFFAPAMGYAAGFTTRPGLRLLLRWLPRLEGAGLVGLLVLSVLLFPFMGKPLPWHHWFLPDDPDYATARPLLSRGRSEYAYELHLDDDPNAWLKPVRVRYLPLVLVWATPLPPASLDSTWTLRREAGLDLLAPRYRAAAKEELARRPDGVYRPK
jgi:hypothetical protein